MKKLVTPETASKILENNTVNRKAKPSMVAFLSEEMRSGRFIYNGESIIISETNKLLDGQHRLMGIIQSGIPCYLNIEYGVSDLAMHTIDTGSARTAADVFHINNIENSSTVSCSIRLILEEFGTRSRVGDDKRNGGRKGTKIKISHTEILDFYNRNITQIVEMSEFCRHLYSSTIKIIVPSQTIAYLYLFSRNNNYNMVRTFIREIYTGVKEGESNAAILVHKKLINDKMSITKMSSREKTNLLLYAFDKYKNNITIKQMKSRTNTVGFLKFDNAIAKETK